MAHQRKTWKKFLNTILSRLPTCIEKYPPEDQVLLNEFLTVLQYYEKADYNRTKLIDQIDKFNKKYYETEQYLQIPFLWFAYTYFRNANLILSVVGFHADNFFEYLVKHLRGDNETKGVFGLLCEKIPLMDIESWQNLQYACAKLFPLTSEQLHCLETIFTYVAEAGIHSLNYNRLKDAISSRVRNPRLARNLAQLFVLLEARWRLMFHLPAFGLTRLYFQFQLNDSIPLSKILDLRNPKNTTLGSSIIYNVSNSENSFTGLIVVPAHLVERLEIYLRRCEQKGQLSLIEMSQVDTIRTSYSLAYYKAGKGWHNLTETEWKRLSQPLKTIHPRKRRTKQLHFFLSPSFKDDFHYKEYPEAKSQQIISIYCKAPRSYTFNDLSLNNMSNQSNFNSRLEILKELHDHQVLQVSFSLEKLNQEFSWDIYWVKIPRKFTIDQLSRILELLPYTSIIYTNVNYHLLTFLTPKLVRWISTDLKWIVLPISYQHYPVNPVLDWYDSRAGQWKTPNLLEP